MSVATPRDSAGEQRRGGHQAFYTIGYQVGATLAVQRPNGVVLASPHKT